MVLYIMLITPYTVKIHYKLSFFGFCRRVIAILNRFWGMRRLFHLATKGFTRGNWLIDFVICFYLKSFMHLSPFLYEKKKNIIFVDMVQNRPFIGYN